MCNDLQSGWCCPEVEQGQPIAPLPPPDAQPVMKGISPYDQGDSGAKHQQGGTGSYPPGGGEYPEPPSPPGNNAQPAVPGLELPSQPREKTNQSMTSQGTSETRSGRTASEWAADQEQFAHLPPLPPGWLRVLSRSSGKIYFCYPETGETTFTEPTGPPPSVAAANNLPEGWVEMVSRSNGRTYFWNAALQKSQFEKPTRADGYAGSGSGSRPEAQEAELPPGWVEMVSRSTGKKYYFNSATQQSQFEKPTA